MEACADGLAVTARYAAPVHMITLPKALRELFLGVQARIRGSLKVFFYDTEAGTTDVQEVFARPRALSRTPYMLEVI